MNARLKEALGELAFGKLKKASITLDYLQNNSSTHTTPFSAIAELCDNSYDADAKNLYIDFIEKDGLELMEFLDDGTGMSPKETVECISFGHCFKNSRKIGQFGNGLKSGAFHIGRELLLLTKKDGIQTALFISQKFLQEKRLTEVHGLCLSFDEHMNPLFHNEESKSRHEQKAEVIMEYAPLGSETMESLFTRITGNSGTLIIINGLQRSVFEELSMTEDDIQLDREHLAPHESSLRKYLEILYLNPKMRIYFRKQEVHPKKKAEHWIAKQYSRFRRTALTASYNEDMLNIETEIANLKEEKRNIESEIGGSVGITEDSKMLDRQKQLESVDEKLDAANEKKENIKRSGHHSENLYTLYFGVETKNRGDNGIHFYMSGRLIMWGHKEKSLFFNKSQPKEHTIGISMFVDFQKYHDFHPTLNKQGFDNARDFNALIKKCDEYLFKYSNYLEKHWIIAHFMTVWKKTIYDGDNNWEVLWKTYGYQNPFSLNCQQTPFDDNQKKIIDKECGIWRLCQNCRSWRCVKSVRELHDKDPTIFQCENTSYTTCSQENDPISRAFKLFIENWTAIPTRPRPPVSRAPENPIVKLECDTPTTSERKSDNGESSEESESEEKEQGIFLRRSTRAASKKAAEKLCKKRKPTISHDDEIITLRKQLKAREKKNTRLEDKLNDNGHKMNCVLDVMSRKFGVNVPATGSPWDKLNAVYETMVPRSGRNAKK